MLRRTVDGMLATLPWDSEIIVVDDQSSDGSTDFLDERYAAARLVRTPERLGVARSRNLGATQATGRVLVFSDAHVEVGFGWLPALTKALAEPGVGAAGPVVCVMGNPAAKGYGYTLTDLSLGTRWLHWQAAEPHPVPMVCGCFMAIRRDIFDEVGRFDDGFQGWGAEDSELSMRLWLLGYECRLVPEVEVTHLFRQRFPYDVDMKTSLHNNLRLAATHLEDRLLEGALARVAGMAAFPGALAQVMSGDVMERRHWLRQRRRRDSEWYFDRFEIPVN